jgi:Cell wall-associated hydrolases (invasion-associated proteins)
MDRNFFVSKSLSYLGCPAANYRGPDLGRDINGFDCSGFVHFILKELKYPGDIPRHAKDFFDYFGFLIHEQFVLPGDLVFFSEDGVRPGHVAVMISADEYIHSPGMDGEKICISKIEKEIIRNTESKSQIYFYNPIGFKRIAIKSERRWQKVFLK